MSRRAATSPMSFFSFQDIMACVTGIMILVALILALDPLSDQPSISATAGQSDALRQYLASAHERVRAARESVEEKSAALEEFRTTPHVTAGQIQRLEKMQQEEERRIESIQVKNAAAVSALEQCENEILLLTNDVRLATEKERAIREQINDEQMKGRIRRQSGPFEPLQPLLLEVTTRGVAIGSLDQDGIPRQTEFIHDEVMRRASLIWASQWMKVLATHPPPAQESSEVGWYALFIIRDDAVSRALSLYSNLFSNKWEAGWQIWDSSNGGFFDPLEELKP